jgi:hypothetical protein
VHKFFVQSPALKAVILVSALTAIVFYVFVGLRYIKYANPKQMAPTLATAYNKNQLYT